MRYSLTSLWLPSWRDVLLAIHKTPHHYTMQPLWWASVGDTGPSQRLHCTSDCFGRTSWPVTWPCSPVSSRCHRNLTIKICCWKLARSHQSTLSPNTTLNKQHVCHICLFCRHLWMIMCALIYDFKLKPLTSEKSMTTLTHNCMSIYEE